jgi:hypothetical protein
VAVYTHVTSITEWHGSTVKPKPYATNSSFGGSEDTPLATWSDSVIIDKEEAIKDDDIEGEIKQRIEKISGTEFDVYTWPKSNSDIPDNKKLKLIVLSPQLMVNDSKTMKFIADIINKYSTGFRTYKNTLMFLAIDPNEYEGFKRIVRRFIALNTIKTEKETLRMLVEDKDRVDQKFFR